ncbi:hypothetical protein Lepto7376_2945 [[Leptolyngbya] sp. PCC 7376]|uniref:hypothetical protein n=1 Tax=[Leptolyngbya] sp. PCC 7376 TaxID=111781 RepID=UPI00029F1021|nr:hypothetical protein [[Leptolyngbya] sp. PCC 7376]AFY39195.1 hypothetical protein Lepto7376_2945 [[Leptolyngbya] sp. PCC 7376]
MKLKLKWWWYIAPAYLTAWSVIFSAWNLIDGTGMMAAFQVDIGEPSTFIMLNSAARYVAIAVGMVLGIWIFRTFHSILTVLLIRLVMDALDLYSGLVSGLIDNPTGIMQSCIMFIFPNLFALWTLIQLTQSSRKRQLIE